MCVVRFGSYSTVSIVPTMPSLSRLKSIRRYFWREPPPLWRVVMRPLWLRAPVLLCETVSGAYGSPLCRCDRSTLTTKRAPGEVGLSLISAIVRSLLLHRLGFVVDRLAGGQRHVSLLPILRTTD